MSLIKVLDSAYKDLLDVRSQKIQENTYEGPLQEISWYYSKVSNTLLSSSPEVPPESIESSLLDVIIPLNSFLLILKRYVEKEALFSLIQTSSLGVYLVGLESTFEGISEEKTLDELYFSFNENIGYLPLKEFFSATYSKGSLEKFFNTLHEELFTLLGE